MCGSGKRFLVLRLEQNWGYNEDSDDEEASKIFFKEGLQEFWKK